MRMRTVAAMLAVAVVSASTAQAQGKELTFDLAGITFGSSGDESTFRLDVNEVSARLGFPITQSAMLEPFVSFDIGSFGDLKYSEIGLGTYVPFYLSGTAGQGLYIAPLVGVDLESYDDGDGKESDTQTFFGVEVGKKIRVTDALFMRLAGRIVHAGESDFYFDYTEFGGRFMLTVVLP